MKKSQTTFVKYILLENKKTIQLSLDLKKKYFGKFKQFFYIIFSLILILAILDLLIINMIKYDIIGGENDLLSTLNRVRDNVLSQSPIR